MTKVSFVNSCYNAARFLDGLVDNLLLQDDPDFEIIIVDSKSTDDSLKIANNWGAIDKRVRVIEQPERTPYGESWLVGWQAATGDVVCNSNSDDRSYQWRARKVYEAYQAQMGNFYYGGYETRVDNRTTAKGIPPVYSVDDMSRFFRCGVHVHWDNQLRNVADWDRMFQASREYRSAFDYWLVLYFMSLGAKGVPIPSCFSIYNQRSDSLEQSDKERNTFESLRAIETFYPESQAIRDLNTLTKKDTPDFYERYQDFKNSFN
jgi:glycosyltransferase involved in cell wall biosynthesis